MAKKKSKARATRKSARDVWTETRYRDLTKVVVKFRNALAVRLRDGAFADVAPKPKLSREAAALTAEFKDARWQRVHGVEEAKLDALRALAQKNSGKPHADLNNQYVAFFEDKARAAALLKRLAGLRDIEYAHYAYQPPPPPVPPDFTAPNSTNNQQFYLNRGEGWNNGIDAKFGWTMGATGDGVSICDVEYSWNFDHIELQGLQQVGPPAWDPFNSDYHGTSVVGVYGGRNDGVGVRGIAFEARRLAAAVFSGWYNVAAAITHGIDNMGAGDVILIEQHLPGPNVEGNLFANITGTEQHGLVPSEWDRGVWDTIREATAAGIIVVEAAGNGYENLDSDDYVVSTWFSGTHAPFRPGNDSGAIMVGAGVSSDRSRWNYSNYGKRVDVQGWGDNVVTAAGSLWDGSNDADLWSSDGINAWYTGTFAGTSSASAIVAGICASLQTVFRNFMGRTATPDEMRRLLRDTGRPQGGNTGEHIGPLPNLRTAIEYLRAQRPPTPWVYPASGEYPQPLDIRIAWGDWFNFDSSRNPAIWTTTDGSRPEEGGATSTRLCSGYACRDGRTLRLEQSGVVPLRIASFMDSPFDGSRKRTDVLRPYRLYLPFDGPANLRASQGSVAEAVRVSWSAVEDASAYEVYTGYGGEPSVFLGEVAAPATHFLHADAAGEGSQYQYWVRARIEPRDRVSRFSGPVTGWRPLPGVHLQASKRKLQGRILVEWTRAPWEHFANTIEYQLYRSGSASRRYASLIFTARHSVEWIPWRDIHMPRYIYPPLSYEDAGVIAGRNYWYWIKVVDQNLDLPPTWSGPAVGRAML